jgi:hypothetical protein
VEVFGGQVIILSTAVNVEPVFPCKGIGASRNPSPGQRFDAVFTVGVHPG